MEDHPMFRTIVRDDNTTHSRDDMIRIASSLNAHAAVLRSVGREHEAVDFGLDGTWYLLKASLMDDPTPVPSPGEDRSNVVVLRGR